MEETMMQTRRWMLSTAAAAAASLALPAAAQDFPTKNIKLVVPFAAGSATDALARILGEHLSRSLGKPVVIENMPGASGILAAQNVVRADPDGHTLLITTNTTHGANQSLLKTVPYDAVKDFEAVGKLGTITLALTTHQSVPAKTVGELVTYAKANPGKLTFGAGSSSSRIAGEMLKSLAGLDLTYVPYRSNPQAITDLLGGQISIVFADISTTLPQIKAEGQRARRLDRQAQRAGPRSADHGGGWRRRLRSRRLVRSLHSGEDAAPRHREAEPGLHCRAERQDDSGTAAGRRHRAGDKHAGRTQGLRTG
jgi:tripartite-type tricarboxylate transporter receptor subunit TctC